ncbi:MAG TPA: LysR family transcriptional regulator [Burkholderiaceae bacterium]|nr:LysR family transcriptional regulator [Burkholderiaceae bacterium]
MRVFQQVATEGSFSGAARKLDLSATVVTRLVVDLEEHLGTRLIQRTTRRMVLTEAGRVYLDKVNPILDAIDEAHAVASAQTDEIQGTLRVHAPPVLAVHVLAPLIAGFRTEYPNVVLDIDVDAPANPTVEQFDITLMGAPSDFNGNVVARPVLESFGILVAAPAYLQRMGVPNEPADLAAHEGARLHIGGARPQGWKLYRSEGDKGAAGGQEAVETSIRPVLWANHTDTLLRAALDGVGITSLPVELAIPHLCSQTLIRVLPDWITGRFTLFAALPSRRFVPRRTQVFMDYLIRETRRRMDMAIGAC